MTKTQLRYLTIKDIADHEKKRPDVILVQKGEMPGFPKIILLIYGNRRYYCEQMRKDVSLIENHFSGMLRGSAVSMEA